MLKRKNRSYPSPVLVPVFTEWASLRFWVPSRSTNTSCAMTVSGASDWLVMSRSDCSL